MGILSGILNQIYLSLQNKVSRLYGKVKQIPQYRQSHDMKPKPPSPGNNYEIQVAFCIFFAKIRSY